MELGSEDKGEGPYYFANVFRAGKHVCRLFAAGKFHSEDEARRNLAVRARHWIADYLSRPGSGSAC
jgi:hypothetical protein